jgi:hypothetical protein
VTDTDIQHLAFSIAHGTFRDDSIGGTGGCSCELCQRLLTLIDELRKNEAADFYNQHYPPPGGFL